MINVLISMLINRFVNYRLISSVTGATAVVTMASAVNGV